MIYGKIIGVTKGDTRSLDISSCGFYEATWLIAFVLGREGEHRGVHTHSICVAVILTSRSPQQ